MSAGPHVAALRYVCRVAQGKTILLVPGIYDLEGRHDPDNPLAENDDILNCESFGNRIKGCRSGETVTWKPNKGSLIRSAH